MRQWPRQAKSSRTPASCLHCATKYYLRMSPVWRMPAPVVTCMGMLCSPHRRLAYGRCQRQGWHDGPTAWTVRRHGETTGPRPHVPRRDGHGGRVCRGAEPAALWRGICPRGSTPHCGDGVAERPPGPPGRWVPRALPAGAGRRASARGRGRACGPRAGVRGQGAHRLPPSPPGGRGRSWRPSRPRGRRGSGLPRCARLPASPRGQSPVRCMVSCSGGRSAQCTTAL